MAMNVEDRDTGMTTIVAIVGGIAVVLLLLASFGMFDSDRSTTASRDTEITTPAPATEPAPAPANPTTEPAPTPSPATP